MLPPTALPTRLRLLVDPPREFAPAHDATSTRLRSIAARLLRRRPAPARELAPDEPAPPCPADGCQTTSHTLARKDIWRGLRGRLYGRPHDSPSCSPEPEEAFRRFLARQLSSDGFDVLAFRAAGRPAARRGARHAAARRSERTRPLPRHRLPGDRARHRRSGDARACARTLRRLSVAAVRRTRSSSPASGPCCGGGRRGTRCSISASSSSTAARGACSPAESKSCCRRRSTRSS